ncbi:arginine N-methyltransferase 2 [Venturia nashicola]|uniref:Arginine N-methyltransferase 2 n=1 Tax=Venturia nashicola TaxID=86259 RepID=A0A4Z1PJW7_9PEZI|nr:arginine N-methyltransferase 2 [Venturia nashicola]TLD35455.1 arginine N-methyltransferase 2 [Venturia nashicola]
MDSQEIHLLQIDTDLTTQSLLLAAAHHDIASLKNLLKTAPANLQDAETGFTPLHAAIAAFEEENVENHSNGDTTNRRSEERKKELESAAETVRLLLQNGAIWNDLDLNNETPGCMAKRLGLEEIYGLMVDAGVRAELLLSRLDEYQALGDNSEDGEKEEEEEEEGAEGSNEVEETARQESMINEPSANNDDYLKDTIEITNTTILDSAANGVMMDWETPLMERHAELLCQQPGLRILNIGHGMGIIDRLFQSHSPESHHIVEAHPDVLKKMRENGWYDKPGVVVHEGKWQDILPTLGDIVFDAIYFDTFAEEYKALREFFSEWVVQFLDSEGKMSFFNGMGADRQICYNVYTKVVEMDLYEAGLDVEWEDVNIPDLKEAGEWNGVRRPYWALGVYKLPTCKFIGCIR